MVCSYAMFSMITAFVCFEFQEPLLLKSAKYFSALEKDWFLQDDYEFVDQIRPARAADFPI